MKRILILTSCLFLVSNSLIGQWQKKFRASGYGGYEHNIFLSPATLLREGELVIRQDLLTSGFYEGISFGGDFEKEFEGGRWKLSFATSAANFHTTPDADRLTLNLKSSYRKRYAKGKYFEMAPSFTRRSQQGINESDGVLRTTFSYTRFNLPVHLDYYLGSKTWFKTETGYTFKAYDQNDLGEKVSYHAAYTGFGLSKKWEKDKVTSKLTFSGNLEYRHYTDLEVEEDGEEEDDEGVEENETVPRPNNPIGFIAEERQWFFYRVNLEYNVKNGTSKFDYTIGLYYVGRGDSEQRFGYSEISPGISINYRAKGFSLNASTRYSMRKFRTLEVGENDELLRYKYLRTSLRLNVPLSKGKIWFIKGNLIDRQSSRTDISSTAFRGYFNNSIETGITIRF